MNTEIPHFKGRWNKTFSHINQLHFEIYIMHFKNVFVLF